MSVSQTPTADGTKTSDNLSAEEFISERIKAMESPETEVESEESELEDQEGESDDGEETTHDEESGGYESEDGEEEPEEEEQPSGEIDLLSLEPEQIQELAKKAKSRLLKDVGKLRHENRTLQEQLASLQNAPAKSAPYEANNPYQAIKTIDEVKAKVREMEETLEITDQVLEKYEDYGPDDEIQVGNQTFTKRDIRKANRNAREAITKHLPSREKQLATYSQMQQLSERYQEAALNEVPEIDDDESEVGKFYQSLVSDPLIEQVKEKIPELGAQIEYILAHASRSIRGSVSKVPKGAGKNLKAKPPVSPVGSASVPKKQSTIKAIEEARRRYEKTGSSEDYQAYRLAQMQTT